MGLDEWTVGRLDPEAPACRPAVTFVRGQSGARYNPPASPVQHQRHSGRNILRPLQLHLNTKYHQCGTVAVCSLSLRPSPPPPPPPTLPPHPLRITNAPQEKRRGRCKQSRVAEGKVANFQKNKQKKEYSVARMRHEQRR